jgi:hypothetical protein
MALDQEDGVAKYAALKRVLSARDGHTVEMSFDEIDEIVGKLPRSARVHQAWWANERGGSHVQAHAWLDAGWRVESVDLKLEKVRFVRDTR